MATNTPLRSFASPVSTQTRPTSPIASVNASVFGRKFMTMLAMGFGFTFPRAAVWLLDVLAIRAGDAMPRIDTALIPTDAMIKFHAFGDGANERFVGIPMRADMLATREPELSVTKANSGKPRPAFSFRADIYLRPKPLSRRSPSAFSHLPVVSET